MKKINLTSLLFICILAFTSCKKDKSDPTNKEAENVKEFFENFGPKTQSENLSFGATGTSKTIILKGGTKITIEPGTFTINGTPVSGDVKIEALEMLNRSSILLSGTNTNHISGAPLISQGFIFIDAKVNGVKVDKFLAKPIIISIPAKGNPYTMIWEGVEQVGEANQLAWQAPLDAGGNGQQRDLKATNDDFIFNFGKLGWVNCDIFYNSGAPKTTVKVTIPNNPGDMGTFRGHSGNTFVFFCAKGDNVVAQIYTADGNNTVKSYDDSMPIGSQGKLISFSIKDGKYYLASKDITITANLSETLTLVETTESTVQSALSALDNY